MKNKSFLFLIAIVFFSTKSNAQYSQMTDSLLAVYEKHDNDSLRVTTLGYLFQAHLYNNRAKAKKYIYQKLDLSIKNQFDEEIARTYFHLGNFYVATDLYDSAEHFYNLAVQKFKDLNHLIGQIWAFNGLATVHYNQGLYEKSLALTDTAIAKLKATLDKHSSSRDSINLAVAYDFRGSIESARSNYKIALENTLQALNYLKDIDKPIRKADALTHLAEIENNLGHQTKSLEYATEAYAIYKKYNDKAYLANVANHIGLLYYTLGQLNAAEQYLNESLALSIEMDAKATQGSALTNLGKLYRSQKKYAQALVVLDSGLHIHEKIVARNKIAEALIELGILYQKMGKPAPSLTYLNRAIMISDSLNAQDNLRKAIFHRSEVYEMLGNFKLSLNDYKKYQTIGDSIFSIEKSQQIEELRSIYEAERREQQIKLQSKEIELLEQNARIGKMQKSFLLGGLILVVIILALLLYTYKQKIHRNKLAREKLHAELSLKKKKLTSHALLLAKKNEVLEDLKRKVEILKQQNGTGENGYQTIINTINSDMRDDQSWNHFTQSFEEVHTDFNATVKSQFPKVTSNELRLMALLKMNLSSKEIANILNISQEGVKKSRYRLRKKLNLQSEESLQDLILNM